MLFLALFLLTAASTQLSFVARLNQIVLDWFNFLPSLLFLIYPFNIYICLIWLAILSFFLYKQDKKTAFTFVFVFFATLFIEVLFKAFLETPGETSVLFGYELAGGYPSGHVLRATLFAGGLRILGFAPWVWILPASQAVAMLSIDGHWPTDLLGGFLLAAAGLCFIKKNSESN